MSSLSASSESTAAALVAAAGGSTTASSLLSSPGAHLVLDTQAPNPLANAAMAELQALQEQGGADVDLADLVNQHFAVDWGAIRDARLRDEDAATLAGLPVILTPRGAPANASVVAAGQTLEQGLETVILDDVVGRHPVTPTVGDGSAPLETREEPTLGGILGSVAQVFRRSRPPTPKSSRSPSERRHLPRGWVEGEGPAPPGSGSVRSMSSPARPSASQGSSPWHHVNLNSPDQGGKVTGKALHDGLQEMEEERVKLREVQEQLDDEIIRNQNLQDQTLSAARRMHSASTVVTDLHERIVKVETENRELTGDLANAKARLQDVTRESRNDLDHQTLETAALQRRLKESAHELNVALQDTATAREEAAAKARELHQERIEHGRYRKEGDVKQQEVAAQRSTLEQRLTEEKTLAETKQRELQE